MKKRSLGLLTLGLLLSPPAVAEAGDASAALAAAERAYQDVDFPTAHEQAERALESGGETPEETARAHVLLGISSAALGDADEAKAHFVAALAVDPALRLDKSLSPKLRDPYLQAQGFWSVAGERLGLRATPSGDAAHLVVRLHDPASLVSKIELRMNARGSVERSSFELDRATITRFAVPKWLRERDYEYALRALDRYGNVLVERGSELDPELVQRAARPPSASDGPRAGRSYLLPSALAVTGLGAVAAGIVFNVKREQGAREWNGPRCENPGLTRQEQCQSVDSRIQSDERFAVGFYAGGGALIAGSVIALIAGRGAPAPTERASAFGCRMVGPGVSCLGQF